MKISTTKIRQIIKEELQRVLTEQGDDDLPPGAGSTEYAVGRIPAQPRDLELDLDKTQEVDVAAALKREQEALADSQKAMTFREEAERLFNIFFADYDIDSLEIMTHNDPELEDIVAKLYGWNLNLFPHDVQPSPTIVKVAQDFEKEGKAILDNEGEFLDRVEKELYAVGLRDFATTDAGSEEDLTQIQSQQSDELQSAAETFAVNEIIKILKNEQPEKHGKLPLLQNATIPQVRELMDGIPLMEPKLFKQAYDWYIKNRA